MSNVTRAAVENYYDERVAGKLRDFTQFNPRIEAAVQTLAEWAPSNPSRVLEVGCGIGATTWRMARAWQKAEVVGIDISRGSIEVARSCFKRSNLSYRVGMIGEGNVDGRFDLVLLMDVYEHVAPTERAALHAAVKSLLSDQSRVVMTVPTPRLQQFLRIQYPSAIQPIDEDIGLEEIKVFALETNTSLVSYRTVGVWRDADYAHAVFGRFKHLGDVAARESVFKGITGLKRRVKLSIGLFRQKGARNYLGYDICTIGKRSRKRLFDVSARERRRRAALWVSHI